MSQSETKYYIIRNKIPESKQWCKDQESMQLSTTPDT